MKRLTLTFGILIVLAVTGLAYKPETVKVRLGQTRPMKNGGIALKFISIVEDSRCPMNARCIHAGNARVELRVSRGRSSKKIQLNSYIGDQSVEAFGYKIAFVDLQPQSGAPPEISCRPKTVTIEVTLAAS